MTPPAGTEEQFWRLAPRPPRRECPTIGKWERGHLGHLLVACRRGPPSEGRGDAQAAGARRERIKAGAEALCGRVGVVRRWSEAGQVFVDGALWRARHEWAGTDGEGLHEGDPVVVERVSGLTLSVRRAEEWELIA